MTTHLWRALVLLLLVLPAQGAPLSGIKTIGPTGDYTSIGAAITDVQAQTLGGALVMELQAAYVSTVETFPLVFTNLTTTVTNTLTLRPQAGATGLAISSANTTAATVDLNGAQFVTIDGRPGGVGTAKQLSIANTSTSGVALRFINEASGNTVQYTTLQGVNTSTTSGAVVFSITTGANGNDNNTIDHCDICDGATTPTNGIYSSGSTATTAKNNSGSTVSNCNIFNFYAATAVDAAGVRLDAGNTGWTFTGNSFYQTASRAGVTANVRAVYINNFSGDNFVVTGNFIGGSAPNAGGTAWTTTGTSAAYQFQGIRLSVGTTTPSGVQGNTIQNFIWTSSYGSIAHPGVWSGIYMEAGSVNVGTVMGNTIGSGIGTGSVSITTSGSGGTSFGIASDGLSTISICNNTIGSMTVNGTASTVGASLVGIYALNGTPTIRNNIVGSATTAGSLNAATSSTSSQKVTGILSPSDGAIIADNTVANLNNNYVGTSTGYVFGIDTYSGANTITGNAVRNLSTTSRSTGTTTLQSVCGIMIDTATSAQAVSQNVVHSLANTAASAAVCVSGIYYDGNANSSVISRNLVHSLAVSSSSALSQVNGMYFIDGAFTAQNNVVRVGLDSSGAATAGASMVRGIYDNGADAGRNFYHNSVYVGGTQTSGAASTFAFDGITGVTNARTYQNNIFVNARSNNGSTGKHYAVRYGGSFANATGLSAGGNLFLAGGTGGVLGNYNATDSTSLNAWQAASGQDASSAVAAPFFVNPAGEATVVDLHLQASNPAEGGGTQLTDALTKASATVTDDFDGQTRSSLTPADIGADAGNFTSTSGDTYSPAVSYPLLTSGSTANRVLTGWAAITDNSGSVAGGANAPRLYFKKSTDADLFGVANDSTGNGWKYVTATGNGPYSFTLDYSLINGGSVSAGDTVQYFVVAQDAANNLGSNPAAATASANPPIQNISAKPGAGVNSFSIVPAFSGTKTVGNGGDYHSLSGAGGLFAALNGGILTGNLVVNMTSDVTEDGSVTLNPWQEEGAGNYTFTIQPDSATMRTISGSANAGLITLNGADRVTIEGRFGGSGRYLTFRNTNTGASASTILFINDASSNTMRNCVLEGASTSATLGVIGFSTGTVTGNDNNLITGCQVRDLSSAAGVANRLIGSSGSSTMTNSGNTISNNELFNFKLQGIYITATGNLSWTLSDNNIYEVNAATSANTGIQMQGGGTNIITGNSIHDLLTTATQSIGINVIAPSGASNTTIARNRITALNVNTATTQVYGISVGTSQFTTSMLISIVNNQVTLSPAAAMSTNLYGLFSNGSNGVVNAYYNSIVLGGSESGTRNSWASLRQGTSVHTMRDNLFLDLRTGGTGSHFAAGYTSGSGYTSSRNVYAGTGATVAANFMSFSGTGVSFATWQSSTGDTNSQAGIAGSGNYTSAMFVNAATGDLHLVPGGNALVNVLGTPIAGVTDDYDGDTRSLTTPTIGSDEFVPIPDIAVAQTTALIDGTGSVDFGTRTVNSPGTPFTFTITNPGTANLSGLVVTGGTSEFTVSTLSGTSVTPGGAAATFTVTFTPSTSGARSATLQIASNVTDAKNPFDISLTGTGLTATESWRQQFFGITTNTGNAADTFDYDHDGLPNLIEWACNLNPITASILPASAARNGANVEFTYTRSVSALNAGTGFAVEWSDTLGNDWQSTGVNETILSNDGTVQQVKATLPAGSAGRRFVHLKVTGPPG